MDRQEINDVRLYNVAHKSIIVKNPFDQDAEFSVSLVHMPGKRLARRIALHKANPKKRKLHKNDIFVVPNYFLNSTKIFIKSKKQAKVKFSYIPLTYEVHICHVVLADTNVGEIQYDLVGTPQLPNPLQTFPIMTNLEHNKPHSLLMSMNYKQKLDAYLRVGDYIKKEPNVEYREFVQDFLKREKDYESFKIDKSNGDRDITLPETFKMVNLVKLMREEDERLNKIDQKEANNLKVSLNFRNAVKDYSVLFMLKNSDLTDVRVYELNITVLPRIFKAILEF